jgi:hypothetical protein
MEYRRVCVWLHATTVELSKYMGNEREKRKKEREEPNENKK